MDYSDYHTSYNELLSQVADDLSGSFAALSSPTLSKQETVTHLYKRVLSDNLEGGLWLDIILFPPKIFYSFLRMIFMFFLLGKITLPKGGVVFRSWLEPKCVNSDEVLDEHFRKLPDMISSSNNAISLLHPYDYKLIASYYKKKKGKNNKFITISVLGFFQIVKLHIDYAFTGLAKAQKQYFFRGKNITKFINRSLLIDFLRLRSFTAYQEKYTAKKIASFSPKSYVYVFENQSWEKVACNVMRRAGVKVIGVQGSGFSPIFLNFLPTKLDAIMAARNQLSPDVIFTVGDSFTKMMNENGCYAVPILSFGALRFEYRKDKQGYIIQQPIKKIYKKVLYAFPVHLSQYKEIIKDLINVFGESDVVVDLKFHPQYKSVNLGLNLPSNFNIVGCVDQRTFRFTYDFVLFNDNSFGLESLILGVRSYQYAVNDFGIDDRFFYFNLWEKFIKKDDLAQLRLQLSNSSLDKNFDINEVRSFINSTYKSHYDLDLFKAWTLYDFAAL